MKVKFCYDSGGFSSTRQVACVPREGDSIKVTGLFSPQEAEKISELTGQEYVTVYKTVHQFTNESHGVIVCLQ